MFSLLLGPTREAAPTRVPPTRPLQSKVKESNMYNAIELGGALLISFIINLFVVAAFANGEPQEHLNLENA